MSEETLEAIAEVTSCSYNAGVGRAMAFGLPTGRHFRVTYSDRVGDELHTGELASEKVMPQGMLFPVRYHPDHPHKHAHDQGIASGTVRRLQWVLALGGTGVMALLWWLLRRS